MKDGACDVLDLMERGWEMLSVFLECSADWSACG